MAKKQAKHVTKQATRRRRMSERHESHSTHPTPTPAPAASAASALELVKRLAGENRKGPRPEIWSALHDEATALVAKGGK